MVGKYISIQGLEATREEKTGILHDCSFALINQYLLSAYGVLGAGTAGTEQRARGHRACPPGASSPV